MCANKWCISLWYTSVIGRYRVQCVTSICRNLCPRWVNVNESDEFLPGREKKSGDVFLFIPEEEGRAEQMSNVLSGGNLSSKKSSASSGTPSLRSTAASQRAAWLPSETGAPSDCGRQRGVASAGCLGLTFIHVFKDSSKKTILQWNQKKKGEHGSVSQSSAQRSFSHLKLLN